MGNAIAGEDAVNERMRKKQRPKVERKKRVKVGLCQTMKNRVG